MGSKRIDNRRTSNYRLMGKEGKQFLTINN